MSKLRMHILLLSAWLVLPGFIVQTDGWKEISMTEYDQIITRAESYFIDQNVTVEYKMASYKNYTEQTAHDVQRGKMIVSGKNYFTSFLGTRTIQNKNYRIIIDSTDKTILIANPIDFKEYKPLIENYKVFRSLIVKVNKLVTTEGCKIELLFGPKMKVKRIEMILNKDGFIQKSTTFFNAKADYQDKKEEKPRLETSFTNYKKGVSIDYKKYFDETIYFTVKGDKMSPTSAYKDYTIKDTRLNK